MSYTSRMPPKTVLAERFWTVAQDTLIAQLGSGPGGLATTEAERRLAEHGPNTVADRPRLEIWAKIGRRLIEPLVAILLAAALVSGLTGDWPGFAIIACIVAVSVGLDVVQEHRAELAAERLRDSVAVKAYVRRDGRVADAGRGGAGPRRCRRARGRRAGAGRRPPTREPRRAGERGAADRRALSRVQSASGALRRARPGRGLQRALRRHRDRRGAATMLVVATGHATRFGGVAASLAVRARRRRPSSGGCTRSAC